MKNDGFLGIIILLVIIALGISGGAKLNPNNKSISNSSVEYNQNSNNQYEIQQKIYQTQIEVEDLRKKIEAENSKKFDSIYKGKVSIAYISRGWDTSNEYVLIRNDSKERVPVTGWLLKSESSGQSITIPKSTYLYFAGTQNSEENIVLEPNDQLYLITGYSPNGASFKVNKCSGYLEQFQTFNPSLGYFCPAPRDEDLSSIPKTVNNDACLDYINTMPSCKIQTQTLPANWSYECTKFIYDKINYPSCINTHKNDADFWKNDWRVYLKRSEKLWKNTRENVVLYDLNGKIVSTTSY